MNEVLTQTGALVGKRIFAQAEGSSGAEFLRLTSSRTVTCWPLVRWVTTSLFSLAWPRTLTLLASQTAGPGFRGTVANRGVAFFLVAAFFSDLFLADFFAAGGLVVVEVAAGVSAVGGLVVVCASRPVESSAVKITRRLEENTSELQSHSFI